MTRGTLTASSAGLAALPALWIVLGCGFVLSAAVLVRASLRLRATSRSNRALRAERQVVEAEVGVRDAVLAAMDDGVVLIDAAGRVRYANHAARRFLGRRVESLADLAPLPLLDAIRGVETSGEPAFLDFESAGGAILAAVSRSGEGVVIVLRDVTATRRGERIRQDFVANASHELKTPVSSIVALTEALHEAVDRDPPAVHRFLGLLEQESVRLSRLVGDLLDLSRLEGRPPPATRVRFEEVVGEEIERLRARAEAGGLRFVVDLEGEVGVAGSRADLGLLVHNLLDNAVRYSPEGGSVTVSLRAQDGAATLRVSDTGIGIASRDLGRVFERFYRADPARSRQTGATGLGLSIVKHVAESHGGDVTAQSVLGAGSTFTVQLPLRDGATPTPAPRAP